MWLLRFLVCEHDQVDLVDLLKVGGEVRKQLEEETKEERKKRERNSSMHRSDIENHK